MQFNRLILPIAVICLAHVATAGASLNQGVATTSPSDLLPWAEFSSDIPSPLEATGVRTAERPLRGEEVLDYFRALADASPRARLIEYARSHEGRPLVVLAISDSQTINELDSFRQRHADLLDPRRSKAERVADEKAVAWLAYGIHGDELSSTDASVNLAYWLVAGQDARARKLRDELLILIDPNENPDGRARYLAQTQAFAHRTANPDQDDLSHTAAWPWGRGNHYLFDLNRDWFSMVHPESQRSRVIGAWLPQLMVDCHEMGSNDTYLFPPARHPFNPFLPANTDAWKRRFSDDQAAALDQRGYPYFTGEWNEEFFPGYGSSWAAYQGAIGILYEMSRTGGTLVNKRGGTTRTFAQAIDHQLTSSIANLETLAANRSRVLTDQFRARAAAMDGGKRNPQKAWVIPPDPDHPTRLDAFAALLQDMGIEVHRLATGDQRPGGLHDLRTGEVGEISLTEGTLMVRLDQPAAAMARVLLDPHVPMEKVFFQDEREYLEKGKGSRLYETTAWSMLLGWGLPAYWSDKIPSGDWRAWAAPAPRTPTVVPDTYKSVVIDVRPDNGPRVLADLLQAEVRVRVAEKPFTVGGRAFPRGALVIRREGNIPDLTAALNRIARDNDIRLHPVGTSRSSSGPDLGGSHMPVLIAPRVGVFSGMPVSPTAYGAIWHLLDQELDLRFSSLDIGRFGRLDLSRYNVLVFPSIYGGTGSYAQLLGPDGVERLQAWTRAGGTAIGIGVGARMLADTKQGLTRAIFRAQALDTYPPMVWSISAGETEAAGRPAAVGLRPDPKKKSERRARASFYDVAPVIGAGAKPFTQGHAQGTVLLDKPQPMKDWLQDILPPGAKGAEAGDLEAADARLRSFMPQGAFLRADLDPESWLNYGLKSGITVWFGTDDSIIAQPPVTVAARFPDVVQLHLGGLLWPEAAGRLAGTAYATREQVGRGQVILFADTPVYRRWMKESERMFINAVLMGPGLGTRWSSPW